MFFFFFFSSRRRHTRLQGDWSSDVCSSDLAEGLSPARELSAEIVGIHFEGPFISPARRGVHPAEWIAAPSAALLLRFLEEARGTGQILPLAPELPGALELIAV